VRLALLLALVALGGAACGGDGSPEPAGGGAADGGVVLSLAHEPDPPVTGGAVTWSLTVRNDGKEPAVLTFPSGKRGDVVLEDDRRQEVYRWSANRLFTQAVYRVELEPGQDVVFRLEEAALSVPPGEYDVVATLAAEPEVGPDRQRMRIS
jgi:intracellular proteinase inhibitor BsuPI